MYHLFVLFIAFAGLVFSFPGLYAEKLSPSDIQKAIPKLEEFIEKGRVQSHVPGVAVAIVYQDKILYLKGFGLRNVEKKLEVTPKTVFQLASLSKPITSTVLATQVSQGKIQWDSKIEDLDPNFRLSDPWVTAHLTIKDLISHRSGLPDHAGDLLEDLGYPRDLILHQLRYIKALHAFREHYAYTNFGFSEGAYATSRYLNTTWDALAKEALFVPLQMNDTSYSYEEYWNNSERAATYTINDGKATLLQDPRQPDAQAPAGGASSSAQDLAKWMILQLGGFQEKDIVSEQALQETHVPAILSGFNTKTKLPSFYGLGWDVSYDENGRYFLKHSGAFSLGVRTQVALLPAEKLGIMIISNASPSALPEAISTSFYDLLFKGKVKDGIVKEYNEKWMKYEVDEQKTYSVNQELFTPSLPLKTYVGKYFNDYYGAIEVQLEGENLVLTVGPKKKQFILKHLSRDVFVFNTIGENAVGETQVTFTIDGEGSVRELTVDQFNQFGMGIFIPDK